MKTAKRNHETVDNECTNMFASVCVCVRKAETDKRQQVKKIYNIKVCVVCLVRHEQKR